MAESMSDTLPHIQDSVSVIRDRIGDFKPQVAVVLGSGFSSWVEGINSLATIPYGNIQGFPETTVVGHAGRLVFGELQHVPIVIMQGRFHHYEGHAMAAISIPIRVFKQLGADTLLLTNAAGGINPAYKPGDLMIIRDHINLSFRNPLIGPNLTSFGPRFPDGDQTYDADLRTMAHRLARARALTIHEGVYLYTIGPNYETPAEIRMMASLGADVVGMSTFPEAIVARHADMRIFGLSLVSNHAAGIGTQPLDHQEVIDAMAKVQGEVNQFLNGIVTGAATLQRNPTRALSDTGR